MASPPQFGSRFGFVMAATGFSVGLGNIWRFPYLTGENGGGAFVLIYVGCALLIAVPILIAEIIIGRQGGGSPPFALARLAGSHQRSRSWALLGHLNLLAALLICFLYTVITGWVLAYLLKAVTSGFAGFGALAAEAEFTSLLADPGALMGWAALALVSSLAVIWFGVQQGIERIAKFMMPSLLVMLIGLVIYNMVEGTGFSQAAAYLFVPDFSKVSGQTFLAAISQAFFSIGVGMAAMMTFGAYLPRDVPVVTYAIVIAFIDTSVAILAGLVVFPMVFAQGMDAAGGPGLIFQTLTVAFAQMEGGRVVAIVLFTLLSFAAITSLLGLLEALVAWAMDQFGWSRHRSVVSVGGLVLAGSVLGALSFSSWASVYVFGMTLDAFLDFLPNQIMLPVGGLLISIFAGWVLPRGVVEDAVGTRSQVLSLWITLVRYFMPPIVFGILLFGLLG